MKNQHKILVLCLVAFVLLGTGCARKAIPNEPTARQASVTEKKSVPVEKTVEDKATPPKKQELAKLEERDLHERDLKETAPPPRGLAYIQVGAFADHAGAKKAMSALIADGYKGSRFSKDETDGFYRVQAGVFPDRETAERALKKLRLDFPGSFIIMEPVR